MSEYYAVERSGTSLTHHGILGMKWGIRRYQNKDGSLTAAGRAHYGTGEGNKKSGSKDDKYTSAKKAASRGGIIGGLIGLARVKRKEKTVTPSKPKYDKKYVDKDGILTQKGRQLCFDRGDGRLTEEGKKILLDDNGELSEVGKKFTSSPAFSDMTDAEKKLYVMDQSALDRNIRNSLDTSGIKDKAEKARIESKILDCSTANENQTYKQYQTSIALWEKVNKQSGNLYEGVGVSSGFKKYLKESEELADRQWETRRKYTTEDNGRIHISGDWFHDKEYIDIGKKIEASQDELCGTVLRDIGYEDTEEARRKIRGSVFYDD